MNALVYETPTPDTVVDRLQGLGPDRGLVAQAQGERMKYWLACALSVFCWLIPAKSRAEWDTTDKLLGATAMTALIVDWGQTRYVAKHPERYSERNPFLGNHPPVGRVDAYFIGTITGTLLIADWLKPDNRKLFLGVVTGVEIAVTHRNKSLGIKIAF